MVVVQGSGRLADAVSRHLQERDEILEASGVSHEEAMVKAHAAVAALALEDASLGELMGIDLEAIPWSTPRGTRNEDVPELFARRGLLFIHNMHDSIDHLAVLLSYVLSASRSELQQAAAADSA